MRQRKLSRPHGHDGLQRAKVLTASRRDAALCARQVIRQGQAQAQAQARASPSRPRSLSDLGIVGCETAQSQV